MNRRVRLGATTLLLATSLAMTAHSPAIASEENPSTSEKPATADPYITDDPNVPDDASASTTTSSFTADGFSAPADGTNVSTSASGCKEISGSIVGKSAVTGSTQWSFKQTADWCWSGGKITYKSSEYTVTSPGTYWEFKKLIDSTSSAGTTPPWIRYRQGYFAHCLPNFLGGGCYNKTYPWVKMYMYANGTYLIKSGA